MTVSEDNGHSNAFPVPLLGAPMVSVLQGRLEEARMLCIEAQALAGVCRSANEDRLQFTAEVVSSLEPPDLVICVARVGDEPSPRILHYWPVMTLRERLKRSQACLQDGSQQHLNPGALLDPWQHDVLGNGQPLPPDVLRERFQLDCERKRVERWQMARDRIIGKALSLWQAEQTRLTLRLVFGLWAEERQTTSVAPAEADARDVLSSPARPKASNSKAAAGSLRNLRSSKSGGVSPAQSLTSPRVKAKAKSRALDTSTPRMSARSCVHTDVDGRPVPAASWSAYNAAVSVSVGSSLTASAGGREGLGAGGRTGSFVAPPPGSSKSGSFVAPPPSGRRGSGVEAEVVDAANYSLAGDPSLQAQLPPKTGDEKFLHLFEENERLTARIKQLEEVLAMPDDAKDSGSVTPQVNSQGSLRIEEAPVNFAELRRRQHELRSLCDLLREQVTKQEDYLSPMPSQRIMEGLGGSHEFSPNQASPVSTTRSQSSNLVGCFTDAPSPLPGGVLSPGLSCAIGSGSAAVTPYGSVGVPPPSFGAVPAATLVSPRVSINSTASRGPAAAPVSASASARQMPSQVVVRRAADLPAHVVRPTVPAAVLTATPLEPPSATLASMPGASVSRTGAVTPREL